MCGCDCCTSSEGCSCELTTKFCCPNCTSIVDMRASKELGELRHELETLRAIAKCHEDDMARLAAQANRQSEGGE